MAGLSVIHLGQVPNSGATTFDASAIVQDLLGPLAPTCQLTAEAIALPAILAPVEQAAAPVLGAVQETVGSLPGAPQQPAPGAPGAPPPAPGALPEAGAVPQEPAAAPVHGPALPQFTPFALGRYHSGLPLYNYAELLVGRPAGFGRLQTGALNSELFRVSPGALAVGGQGNQENLAAKDIAAAGQASALPASAAERVALPVLVAVLMLAAVTAAVIRSWVLVTRR